ncbi:hypothetical protein COV18_04415 [Candidatus Woesearchaeota archaeon CG10_big_fil_rev_8_21_14_0_10_37_12]|nr:MAG: hypothetical protein COV18_04415 [Candidatus Woesearchaeota archaeon CG10_big_fil_rev_8_21_14_0_10_37_12]
MPYKFLEDEAIADIAFEAEGKNLNDLFQSAAEATIVSMADPATIKNNITKIITKKANTIKELLFELIEEIIYLKDKDAIVFHSVTVEVNEEKKTCTATLTGDDINHETQALRNDVKAITMHYYTVEKTTDGWEAHIVLDI